MPDNTTLRLSPNGRFLATGDYERTKVWNTQTGECLLDSQMLGEPFVQLTDIYSVDDDCRLLVTNSAHRSGSLYRIDIAGGGYEALPLHYHMDEALADADGIRALRRSSAPGDQTECCDCASGKILWSRSPYLGRQASAFSGDGSRVLFSDGVRLTVVDARTGTTIRECDARGHGVLSHAGKLLADWSWEVPTLRVRSVATGLTLWSKSFPGGLNATRFLPDDSALLVALASAVVLLDAKTGSMSRRWPISGAVQFDVSGDSRTAVVQNGAEGIEFLDLQRGGQLPQSADPPGRIVNLDFRSDRLIGRGKGFRTMWHVAGGRSGRDLDLDAGPFVHVNLRWLQGLSGVCVSADRRIVATWSINDEFSPLQVRDATSGTVLRTVGEIVPGGEFALSPDGRTIAVFRSCRRPAIPEVDEEGEWHIAEDVEFQEIQLLEVATGWVRRRFAEPSRPEALAFSPDGRTLASAHDNAPVFLWDLYGERSNLLPKPDAAALRAAWVDLSSSDSERGFRAMCLLIQHPAEAMPVLARNLKPAAAPNPRRLGQTIEELGDRDYRTREGAERELAELADEVRTQLRAALDAGKGNAEANRRLERLLHRAGATPPILRSLRAHEVLERVGTPAAKAVVESSAKGSPDAIRTKDALVTLARWEHGR